MKNFCIFTVVFLVVGIYSVIAQDLIILKNGDIIEAKITELSHTEIKYKRIDHLDGPNIVIPASNVLSIRYENGRVERISTAPVTGQKDTQAESPKNTAMDANKFIFGINANAGGFLGALTGGSSGAGMNIELGKGNFNTEINLMLPTGGFAGLVTFNGFWPSKIGGFYLGGGIGYGAYETYGYIGRKQVDDRYGYHYEDEYENYTAISLPVGLNIGYKFVTKLGLYFRTGIFLGYDFFWFESGYGIPIYIKPDLAIGWTMK
jgi:hypothetical protein